MTYKQAQTYLVRAERNGYVAYHSGICNMDGSYGINIDGDGRNGRYFGCPKIIWDVDIAEQMFPTRKYTRRA